MQDAGNNAFRELNTTVQCLGLASWEHGKRSASIVNKILMSHGCYIRPLLKMNGDIVWARNQFLSRSSLQILQTSPGHSRFWSDVPFIRDSFLVPEPMSLL